MLDLLGNRNRGGKGKNLMIGVIFRTGTDALAHSDTGTDLGP